MDVTHVQSCSTEDLYEQLFQGGQPGLTKQDEEELKIPGLNSVATSFRADGTVCRLFDPASSQSHSPNKLTNHYNPTRFSKQDDTPVNRT